jgi:serine/threonine protein phosphatase PrpC
MGAEGMAVLGFQPGQEGTTEPELCRHGLQVGLASHPGVVRDRNEDASLVWQFALAQEGQSPLPVGLFGVADGMGGHMRGQQASSLALRLASGYVIRHICLPMLSDDADAAARAPINEILESSVRIAHEAVLRRVPESGTTLTIALVLGNSVYIAHVGDSRAYLGEHGHLHSLTEDHTLAARLVAMGQATPEEVASQQHILFKAIGQGAQIEPDIIYHDLNQGQYLFLCCDGLWTTVPEEQITAIVEAAPTPACACQRLVQQAIKNGGDDNITAILATQDWPLPDRE